MSLLIINKNNFHYEIIESIILNFDKILPIRKSTIRCIVLKIIPNVSFIKYIRNKYPNIIINPRYYIKFHYLIDTSIYKSDYDMINKTKNAYYITHEFDSIFLKHKNVYFTGPFGNNSRYLYFKDLPYNDKKIKTKIPIYIIQGELKRRNWNLLKKILENGYTYSYKIKIIGKGSIPPILQNLKIIYNDKIIIKQNLNFQDYHKEFIDCYGIIPCIDENTNYGYYKNKLTSSISYGLGYNLYFIIDSKLQKIYNVNKCYIYHNNNIHETFKKSLIAYYNNENI